MKKNYKKPVVTIETYTLNENIAACDYSVLFGPKGENEGCGDYGFGGDVSPFAMRTIKPFYDDSSCYCYYTAPEGSGYFGAS